MLYKKTCVFKSYGRPRQLWGNSNKPSAAAMGIRGLIHMHKYFFFFLFLTDLSGTGQKRKKLYEHIGNLDRLSKKGRKVIGQAFLVLGLCVGGVLCVWCV